MSYHCPTASDFKENILGKTDEAVLEKDVSVLDKSHAEFGS